jgi:hypothetical protein
VQLSADGEVPGPAAGVQDGVGREFGRDEDGIGGGGASGQVAGDARRTWCSWSARPG